MKCEQTSDRFLKELSLFSPDFNQIPRSLALYSASIALADEAAIKAASSIAAELGAGIESIHEVMLQSYLFLGFPQMLTAAEYFQESYPRFPRNISFRPPDTKLVDEWVVMGTALCQRVYAGNYEKLRARLSIFAGNI